MTFMLLDVVRTIEFHCRSPLILSSHCITVQMSALGAVLPPSDDHRSLGKAVPMTAADPSERLFTESSPTAVGLSLASAVGN